MPHPTNPTAPPPPHPPPHQGKDRQYQEETATISGELASVSDHEQPHHHTRVIEANPGHPATRDGRCSLERR